MKFICHDNTFNLIIFSIRSRMAADSPLQRGIVAEFSRSHGHGFIQADKNTEEKHIFLHISE